MLRCYMLSRTLQQTILNKDGCRRPAAFDTLSSIRKQRAASKGCRKQLVGNSRQQTHPEATPNFKTLRVTKQPSNIETSANAARARYQSHPFLYWYLDTMPTNKKHLQT